MYVLEPKKEKNVELFSSFKEKNVYKLDNKLYFLSVILFVVLFILVTGILFFCFKNILVIILMIFIIYYILQISYSMDKIL